MNNKQPIAIAILIVIANISGAVFGYSKIDLGFFSGNGPMLMGIIPFCVSFFLFNIYINQYGLFPARKLISLITIIRLILAASVFFVMKFNFIDSEHDDYLNTMSMGFFSGAVASIIALNLTGYIFQSIYNFFKGRYLWLRCLIATGIGELTYSLISNILFLIHHDSLYNIWILSVHNYTFKILFEIITLPLTYLLIYVLSSRQSVSAR